MEGQRRTRAVSRRDWLIGAGGIVGVAALAVVARDIGPSSPGPEPSPITSGSPQLGGTFVRPGTVGYLGDAGALTHYAPAGSGLPGAGRAPKGCSWGPAGLRCDDTHLILDRAYVHGGIFWTGTGSAHVTDSILEGNGKLNWYAFYSQAAPVDAGARLVFTDTTVRIVDPDSKTDVAPIWANNDKPLIATRVESSGGPQGLPCPGGSVIDSCWVHDLGQPAPGSSPLHLDGIFSQGGDRWTITRSFIDVPKRNPSDVTAAVFCQSVPAGKGNVGGIIDSCYLAGGSYSLRNETMVGLRVRNCTFGGATFGDAWNQAPGSIAEWTGNVRADGAEVPRP